MHRQLLWIPVALLVLAGACRGKEERPLASPGAPRATQPAGPVAAPTPATPMTPPVPATPVQNGKRTFEESCASCHGMDGTGATAMGRAMQAGNLAAAATQARLSDEQMAQIIRNGRGRMPAFPLDEATVKALVGYLRTLRQ
jgi:mono/diheme cytochrome c family protein